jgi:phosphatidylserine/phosphatidylglycerophosphate/cardiolipin synthase-like enzyme
MTTARGLSRIPLSMLEQLLVAVERGRLEYPFSEADLVDAGFGGPTENAIGALRGTDRSGVGVALRVAIAERTHRPPPRIDLVWTGPETRASISRSTRLVVERLFEEARRTVVVGGYRFDTPEILRPLHRAMAERAVAAMLFLDAPGDATTVEGADSLAIRFVDKFFRDVWTFGAPKPDIFYDHRTAMLGPPWTSLHAKCVVVDDERALITSANFTDRGQERNIEAGVLIEDHVFASELAGHWRQLVNAGLVTRYTG